jgi:hypothetical protein
LKEHYPKEGLKSITCEWLSRLVNYDVESFTHKSLEDGVLSDAAIIWPKYKNNAKGPKSFVLKYAKKAKEGHDAAIALNVYEKELKFYSKLHEETTKYLPCPDIIW